MELDAQWNPLQEQVEKQNLHKQKDLLVLRFQNLHSDFVFDRWQKWKKRKGIASSNSDFIMRFTLWQSNLTICRFRITDSKSSEVAPKQVKEKTARVCLSTCQVQVWRKKKVLVSVTLPSCRNNRISFYWCVTFLSSIENDIMIPSCSWLQISVASCFRHVSVNGFRFLTYIYTVAHKGHYALFHNTFRIIKYAFQIMHNTFPILRNTFWIHYKFWNLRNTFRNLRNTFRNLATHFEIFTTHSPQDPKSWQRKRKRLRSSFSFLRCYVLFHVWRIFASFVQILS